MKVHTMFHKPFGGFFFLPFNDFKKSIKYAKSSGGARRKGIFWNFIVILLNSLLFGEKTAQNIKKRAKKERSDFARSVL